MIANIITFSRMILSFMMLIFPVFSSGFYVCYLMAGLTDMIDGEISRKLGTSSEFGARLDTVADFIFVIIALYKILPEVKLCSGFYVWIGMIALLKSINVVLGFVLQKRFVTIHSIGNKITGVVLFVLPFTLTLIDIRDTAIATCFIATFAAIREGQFVK